MTPRGGHPARRGLDAARTDRRPPLPRSVAAVALAALTLALALAACRRKAPEPGDDGGPDAATPAAVVAPPPAAAPCAQAPGSFADVAARLSPNLVTIRGSGDAAHPASGPGEALPLPWPPAAGPAAGQDAGPGEALLGTGFLLAADALVITSERVVSRATGLAVQLEDGRRLPATVRGTDPDLGLAVLALDRPVPAALALADASRLRAGDWVAVLSNAFGAGTTVTAGVVRFTADPSPSPVSPSLLGRFLGVDAAIDAANWGGPVVDGGGRLVGLATAAPQAGSRIGLVLPAPLLRTSVAQLAAQGHPGRSWVGLWVRPLERARAAELGVDPPRGLLVTRIAPSSPAQEAGLEANDVILELAGAAVSTPAELATQADQVEPGGSAPVAIVRAGRAQTLRLRPAPMPQ